MELNKIPVRDNCDHQGMIVPFMGQITMRVKDLTAADAIKGRAPEAFTLLQTQVVICSRCNASWFLHPGPPN